MKKFALTVIMVLVMSTLFAGCGSQSSEDNFLSLSGDRSTSQDSEDAGSKNNSSFDEKKVEDYFNYITKEYNKVFVQTDLDSMMDSYSYNLLYLNMTNDEITVDYYDLYDLISNADVDTLTSKLDGYEGPDVDYSNPYNLEFRVQYLDEMQECADMLWGKGSLDIRDFITKENDLGAAILSANDVYINAFYPELYDYSMIPYYEITDIEMNGDTAKVYAHCVSVTGNSYFSEKGYAIDDTDGRLVGGVVENDWSGRNGGLSFDKVISQLGIDSDTLGELVFSIRNTPDGPIMDGLEKTGVDFSLRGLTMPDQILEYTQHCEVDTAAGLNLRYGPGTDFDVITLLPNNLRISELGYNNNSSDWFFASATLDGTEYFGWVNSDYILFYGGMAKPVIYLYPEEPMDVSVEVAFASGGFTCTYPEYVDGWNVFAYPDGRVINNADGLEYSYLYWEGEGDIKYDMSRGFVVKGEDTAAFLREKLSYMGLTPREYNEFIVYWLPLMHNNNYNLITFQTTAYTDNVSLNVTPNPDSMLRIFMAYSPLDEYRFVPEQELDQFERKGFSVIEWGGTEY